MTCAGAEPPACPECGLKRLYRDGLRYLKRGRAVQRWLCRNCGYRFSEKNSDCLNMLKHVERVDRQILNWSKALVYSCRGSCEAKSGASTSQPKLVKTLAEVESRNEKWAAGATELSEDFRGKVVEFLWHLKKNGARNATLKNHGSILRKLAAHTDLTPESVKEYLAKTGEWGDGHKKVGGGYLRQISKVPWAFVGATKI